MNLFKTAMSFLKIGAIGFGGGTALIPVIEKEAIIKHGLMTSEEFKEELALQGITPGALPLKVAAGIGVKSSPQAGAVLVYATAFVGVLLAIVMTAVLSIASSGVLRQVEYIATGISAFVVIVVMKFVVRVPKDSARDKFLLPGLLLLLFALVFSIGGKLESFISVIIGSPIQLYIPELSVTSLIVLGINFVFFTKFATNFSFINIAKYVVATVVTVFGVLCFAKQPVIDNYVMEVTLYIVLTVMISSVVIQDFVVAKRVRVSIDGEKSENTQGNLVQKSKVNVKIPLITIAILVLPMIVFGLIVGLVNATGIKAFVDYTGKSIVATITTFGGGTAFISIAENVFVGGGVVASDLFWTQIVPIANALPGPLLCKMLASIWYYASFAVTANIGLSILYSIYGAIIGITITTVVYLLVYIVFQFFKELAIFQRLKISILPLIAGLLIPTALAMITSMMTVSKGTGIPSYAGLLISFGLIGVCLVPMRFKIKEFIVLVGIGGVSIGLFNLIAYLV